MTGFSEGVFAYGLGARVCRSELGGKRIRKLGIAEERDDIVPDRNDHELVRNAAHPVPGENVLAQRGAQCGQIAAAFRMERAAGERIHIHHVHERGGSVDLPCLGGGKAQHILKRVGVGGRKSAGRTVALVFLGVVAAGGGKFLVVGIGVPHGFQQLQRACRGIGALRGRRAAGAERQQQCRAERGGKDSFHIG